MFLDAPASDGPAPPATPEEVEAFGKVQSGWNVGLIDVKPWAQPMDSDTLGIGWVTASPAVGAAEWTQDEADDARANWRRAIHAEDGLTANNTAQRAVVRGWDPARPLRFRVVSRPITAFQRNRVTLGPEVRSETFRVGPLTDSAGATSFIVFNDTHNRPQNFPILLDAAGAARFAVFNGDTVVNAMNASEVVENLLLPMTWFTSLSMPVLFVRGNHETAGPYARSIKQHLCLPDNRYYGALNVGAARLVFLDGGTGGGEDDWFFCGDAFIAEQCEWLEREVASKEYQSARWRIVIVHAPPDWRKLGREKMSCDRHVNQRFVPILDRCPPHAVIAGHTHGAEVLDPPPDATAGFRFPVFIGGAPDLGRATAIRVDLDARFLSIAMLRADGSRLAHRKWE